MLKLSVLGSLNLQRKDGTSVRSVLSQPKLTAVLIYLSLARRARFRRRDTLLAVFWPELDLEHARNALNQSIYRLRRSLGSGIIETRGREEVCIAEGQVWCDAIAFRNALQEGRFENAMALYRGELLEGFHVSGVPDFEHWLEEKRTLLRSGALRAVLQLADAEQDSMSARLWLERALAIAPADETVVVRMMQLLDCVGDRAGALRAYDKFAAYLESTLDIEPSPETQELAEKIRGRDRAHPERTATSSDGQLVKIRAGSGTVRNGERARSYPVLNAAPGSSQWVNSESRFLGARPFLRVGIIVLAAAALLLAAGLWVFVKPSAPATAIERIAVLPLSNLMDDPEQEYFVQGMHDRLISELQQADVAVIARTSVLPYTDGRKAVSDIVQELGVDAVVEGSVFRTGDMVKIEVRLVDGATEQYLWQETFSGNLRNVAALYASLTRAISAEIKTIIDPETAMPRADVRETDPRAYEAYLNGLFHMRRITSEDLNTAREYFAKALEIDSTYAPALIGLVRVEGMRNRVQFIPREQVIQTRAPLLERALRLDSTLADAHMILGVFKCWFASIPDWNASEASLRHALALNPGLADAHLMLAQLLMMRGRWDEASEHAEIGIRLDPLNPFVQVLYAGTLGLQRRYGEAIDILETLRRRNPGAGAGRRQLSGLYHVVGDYKKAMRLVREDYEAMGASNVVAALDRGNRDGNYAHALRLAADALAAQAHSEYVAPLRIAELYARSGDKEKAIDWLEQALQDGGVNMIGVVPIWEGLHDHPRFQAVARRATVPILTPTRSADLTL